MMEMMLESLSGVLPGSLQTLLTQGGWVMAILIVMGFAGITTAIYLGLLAWRAAPRRSRVIDHSLKRWHEGSVRESLDSLDAQRNPLARLTAFTLSQRWAGTDPELLREELARRSQRILAPFESPLKVLEVIAALAPLLGLLGTVLGMIEAFRVMASAEGGANPSQLSGGIYQALSTTAAGLAVAIPAAAIASFVDHRLRHSQREMHDVVVRALQPPRSALVSDFAPQQAEYRALNGETHAAC